MLMTGMRVMAGARSGRSHCGVDRDPLGRPLTPYVMGCSDANNTRNHRVRHRHYCWHRCLCTDRDDTRGFADQPTVWAIQRHKMARVQRLVGDRTGVSRTAQMAATPERLWKPWTIGV